MDVEAMCLLGVPERGMGEADTFRPGGRWGIAHQVQPSAWRGDRRLGGGAGASDLKGEPIQVLPVWLCLRGPGAAGVAVDAGLLARDMHHGLNI